MIKSMTGFGRCEMSDESHRVTVEMKSVNHRYLDITIKMPKKLNTFESAIRSLLKTYIQRGKVDVYITYEDMSERQADLKYNEGLAAEYVGQMRKIAEAFSLPLGLDAAGLSRFPEVFAMEARAIDEEEVWGILEQAVRGAAGQFVEARAQEGMQLKEDLLGKLGLMQGYVGQIEQRSPDIVEEYRNKLTDKVKELLEENKIEEGRILAEVVVFADKICTDEETVRLKSHIQSTWDTLQQGGSVGRRLDFLAQEMNREANTILSKANDITVSEIAISLKTEIEKVREQIQNIE
ncbi:MAG: YicC family protein [Lachnospiraceae bacterium]|jgi:uncharacterized protein (TIGR00255 family)|nr:YicC family protein [Lachnospiraceae bacterium]